jgi:small ligand-binding sensory domain FIST
MPFASALSVHPVTALAVGEAVGQVLERVGPNPDLVALFVTPHHAGALEDAAAAVRAVLSPTVLLGCAGVAVLGVRHEVEDEAGVSLWAGRFGPVRGFSSLAGGAVPVDVPFAPQAMVLLADPFTFDAAGFFDAVSERWPGLPVVGGFASAARGPGGNRLVLDGAVSVDGAVGALLGPGASIETVVSQGCRPIGNPYVVTKAERNVVYELAGVPALTRLLEAFGGVVDAPVHLGVVVDEHKADFGPGDFLVRNVLGADRSVGAIAVGEDVEVGSTVQFHVRDAVSADADLREALDGRGDADGALLFTCNGRGRALFGVPNHDADVFDEEVGAPVAGFFAAGEFGPVGGRNFVHGFTASAALFQDPEP